MNEPRSPLDIAKEAIEKALTSNKSKTITTPPKEPQKQSSPTATDSKLNHKKTPQ